MLLGIAGAVCLLYCAPALRAQCSSDDDPDSYDCQMQQSAPLPSTMQSSASPTVLSMQQPQGQGTPQSDRSTNASAVNSLPTGSNYTERALREGAGQQGGRSLPVEPPTEFQSFVTATTGHPLPIYGSSLFAQRTAPFGPVDLMPAPQEMVIGTGDELRIRIWGQINFSANLRVSREGEIYLPKVGAVHVAGLEFSAVAGHLRAALDRVYRNFELSVDMGEIHSIQVYVTGLARAPGEYTVSALNTLVNTLFLCGGPSGAGSMRHVELKRAGRVIADFDLYALLVKGDKSGDVQLQSGDVLFIPAAGPQVALLGSVRQSAIFELRGQESMEELLETAGGRTAIASNGSISVERIEDHAQRHAFELKTDAAGLATLLMDGDMVRVDAIVSSYREAVTLRGSVANPGRYLWHAGMRLSDLMPERDALLSRDYWWHRTQLGLPAPEFVSGGAASGASSASRKDAGGRPSGAALTVGNITAGSHADLILPASQTDWNYAVIERLDTTTMTTSLIPFDLGKLVLSHDAAQDQELRPGDTITIFSQDDIHQPIDQQVKYVRLEGEFAHPGVYSVQSDETLRSLVVRAGGLTGKAYLYGSEFTRKSTQAVEAQRLSEYADRLEHQLARGSIKIAGVGVGSMQAGNGGAPESAQIGEISTLDRGLIGRLRQLQPSGRIVLDLHPRSSGENELPEMPLEDGDKLLIPSTPATVQVIGAVMNQNAFLYRDKARVGDFLRLAGGPNRDADRRQEFILRADGSVTNHGAGQSIFTSDFDNQRLYPGDTIVVPEKNLTPGAMREFLAWSQLFSQFSLGAAAINVLK
jgi:protein involved in polysaccharide export with SLBB domain